MFKAGKAVGAHAFYFKIYHTFISVPTIKKEKRKNNPYLMEHLILSPSCLTLPVYWYCTLCKVFLFFCCLELSSLGRFRPFSKISKITPPPFSDLNFVVYLPALSHVQM